MKDKELAEYNYHRNKSTPSRDNQYEAPESKPEYNEINRQHDHDNLMFNENYQSFKNSIKHREIMARNKANNFVSTMNYPALRDSLEKANLNMENFKSTHKVVQINQGDYLFKVFKNERDALNK